MIKKTRQANVQRYLAERDVFIAELKAARRDAREAMSNRINGASFRELSNRCLANSEAALIWLEESHKNGEIPARYAPSITKMRGMYNRSEEMITEKQQEAAA